MLVAQQTVQFLGRVAPDHFMGALPLTPKRSFAAGPAGEFLPPNPLPSLPQKF